MSDITKLGVLLDETAQRDAIHIAVAPVVAAQILAAGEHIGLMPDSQEEVAQARKGIRPIGIVDPFLAGYVNVGQRFYMFLYPQTITSLRHHWTHPAFSPSPVREMSTSEAWLRAFAEEIDLSYWTLLDACKAKLEDGRYYIFHGHDTPDACYGKLTEMWMHYEVITGTKVDDKTEGVFSCSC